MPRYYEEHAEGEDDNDSHEDSYDYCHVGMLLLLGHWNE